MVWQFIKKTVSKVREWIGDIDPRIIEIIIDLGRPVMGPIGPILMREEETKEEFEAPRAKQEARQAKQEAHRAKLEAHRAKLVANLENEKTAFELTLLCFSKLQHNLDTQFPESELS